MAPEPTLIGDLLPELAVSMSLLREDATHTRIVAQEGPRFGVLENNLTRKGIWSTDGGRASLAQLPHQEILEFETDDVVGHLVVHSAMGRLTIHEMEVVSWILAKWVEREDPEDPIVEFTLAQMARDFGVVWGGSRAHFTKQAIEKLDRVRFTAEVWSHARGELVTEHFGIFDRVTIKERKTTRTGNAHGPAPIRVKLNDFLHEQLKAGQFHRYSWQILRGSLPTPLGKRLYVFLDAQRGFETQEGMLYEHKVDAQLVSSLGIRDTNMPRVRKNLQAACVEVARAETRYLRCDLRPGPNGQGWILSTLREPLPRANVTDRPVTPASPAAAPPLLLTGPRP